MFPPVQPEEKQNDLRLLIDFFCAQLFILKYFQHVTAQDIRKKLVNLYFPQMIHQGSNHDRRFFFLGGGGGGTVVYDCSSWQNGQVAPPSPKKLWRIDNLREVRAQAWNFKANAVDTDGSKSD